MVPAMAPRRERDVEARRPAVDTAARAHIVVRIDHQHDECRSAHVDVTCSSPDRNDRASDPAQRSPGWNGRMLANSQQRSLRRSVHTHWPGVTAGAAASNVAGTGNVNNDGLPPLR
jgi:hypothetical protein